MARLRANLGVDMTDLSTTVGRTIFADEDTVVVRVGRADTYYFGEFSYPGGEWDGTIERVFQYYRGVEWWSVTGLDLSTRYATVGATRAQAYRRALSDDDVLVGSAYADKLVAYAGNDQVRGGKGDDLLMGGVGGDQLLGGTGDDRLNGQRGRDVLDGGDGDDRLAGGDRADRFVFDGNDGSDTITDFGARLEKIVIESGARRFDQLDVFKNGDDVCVAFDDTLITLRDVFLKSVGPEDFIF
jgi:Ca2+-binding RTX toxin-like protein